MLVYAFLAAAAVLWLTVFGYVFALVANVAVRRMLGSSRGIREPAGTAEPAGELPSVAVVIPVRNEQEYLPRKLENARRTDYPADRLATFVVDGGSTDATIEIVEAARMAGDAVTLVRCADAGGRSGQLNAVLPTLTQDIVVVTDADAELDPRCIRKLVDVLRADPHTDVVGARVQPATRLVEERIHWWILGSLWWLEGEALGNGQVSGVCYALRSHAALALPSDCTADDIRFGLLAGARGRRVRLCRDALATELRVPQTMREFLTFRRRRGTGYRYELRRVRPVSAPLRWHFVQAVRLWHFFAMPVLAAMVAASGLVLAGTGEWQTVAAAGLTFVAPATAALFASRTLRDGARRWRLATAAGRMAGLVWCSLVALPRSPRTAKGER
jgi:cellulose synthase/poly-beta-1,6-N-acetylglucosamine synthase-like glycosyltransferase